MPKTFMRVFIIVAGLSVLTLLFLVLAPYIVPTKNFKRLIVDDLEQRLPGKATVADFSFRLLPTPTFTIAGISVKDAKQEVLAIDAVTGDVFLMEWLKSKRVSTHLSLTGVRFQASEQTLPFVKYLLGLNDGRKGKALSHLQLRVLSLEVRRGKIDLETGGATKTLDQVALSARDLGNQGQLTSFEAQGNLLRAEPLPFSLAGKATLRNLPSVLRFQDVQAKLGSAEGGFSGTLDLEASKFSAFSVNASSVAPELLQIFYPTYPSLLPFGLSWSGPAGLQVTKNDGADQPLAVMLDFGASTLSAGKWLTKGAGYPFKLTASVVDNAQAVSFEGSTLELGAVTFGINGTVRHGAEKQAKLTMQSKTFDLSAVRPYASFLTPFEGFASGALSFTLEGPLATETPLVFSGKWSAVKGTAMGEPVDELALDFERKGDELSIPFFKAKLYGGNASGKAAVTLGTDPEYRVESVLDHAQMAFVPGSAPFLKGEGSLVSTFTTQGQTTKNLFAHLAGEGTLVMKAPELSLQSFSAPTFANAVVDAINAVSAVKGEATPSLNAFPGKPEELRLPFRLTQGLLLVGPTEATAESFIGQISIRFTADGVADGEGTITLTPSTTKALFRDPLLAKRVVSASGSFSVPVTLTGTKERLALHPHSEKLAALLKKPVEPVAVALPEPKAKSADRPQVKPAPQQPVVKKKPILEESADDVMKVILGK
ncbi:MAG: hypothetical protein HY540_00715 [Deltaproteobacteria bacterium]|nr:hypothetical protein [Deltaproteobacteria bacterium]